MGPAKVAFQNKEPFLFGLAGGWALCTLLSRDVAARYFSSGDLHTAGIECMPGSAMYLKSTGMSHSQTRTDLSSEVVTKRRLLSMNVIVLIGFK